MLGRVLVACAAASALGGGCIEEYRQQAAVDHYVEGQMLAERGQYDTALAELSKAVQADPKLSAAHAAAGDIYRREGSHELARRAYEKACQTNPYAFRPHYNLGVTYQTLATQGPGANEELLRQAVMVFLRAAEIEPDDFETNLNLSACYFQMGKYKLAETYCRAAIEARRDSPQAYTNLGAIYDSQNRLYEAVRAYKTSLELDNRQPHLLMNLASTYVRQQRYETALRTYEHAAELLADSSEPWVQIGMCLYHLQRYPEAVDAYNRAIRADADNADAHRGLGAVCMTQYVQDRRQTKLRDRALQAWHRSLEIRPQQEDLRRLVNKYGRKRRAPTL
ncbi:MAG: tetratricopeptide repeat protein [Phycisphaerae bacterium]|nr:tetratricopeptide repeat protein [Phycisphaerae bacterium]